MCCSVCFSLISDNDEIYNGLCGKCFIQKIIYKRCQICKIPLKKVIVAYNDYSFYLCSECYNKPLLKMYEGRNIILKKVEN